MAAAEEAGSEAAAAGLDEEEPEGDTEENEVIEYPLRVEYCGLCSMPPEVKQERALHSIHLCIKGRNDF